MNTIVAQADSAPITEIASQAATTIDEAHPIEMTCAIGLPILAIIIGILVNRWVDRHQHAGTGRFVDFLAPLMSPLLTVLFTGLAQVWMHYHGMNTAVLPFVIKLATAWLAIHLVLTLNARNTAAWFIALIIIPVTTLHMLGLWNTVADPLEAVQFKISSHEFTLYLILKTIAALIILIWAAGAISSIVERKVRRIQRIHVSNRMLIMKIFQIVLYFVVFMVGLQIVGIDLTALSVFGGAVGVGVGFGLQKVASNFISGIILLFEKSIEIGDLVELSDGTTGFIRHNGARYTLIERPDGREVLVPNEEFISTRITSYTYSGSRGRIEITLNVDYDTDVEKALALMLEAAKANKRCIPAPAPMGIVNNFADNGIGLTLYFWIGDIEQGTLATRSEVMIAILNKFREANITFGAHRRIFIGDAVA